MKATVLWPGKDWDDKFNPGQKKTQAKFTLEDGSEAPVNSSNPNSPKAMFLKGLKKGDTVILSKEKYHKDGQTHEYWDIDTWELISVLQGGGGASGPAGGSSFMDDFADARKRAKWFFQQGIELAKEVAAELDGPESKWTISDDAVFERGGALGTSLFMDMIHKGHRI